MAVAGETVEMNSLIAVDGENTLRRIGAVPFWEVRFYVLHIVRCNL